MRIHRGAAVGPILHRLGRPGEDEARPLLCEVAPSLVEATHAELGTYWLACQDAPQLLFTENETNAQRLWGVPNRTPYVKDGINLAITADALDTTNPAHAGTKVAAHFALPKNPAREV